LAGKLVKEYDHEGTYNQGEVSWDGTDSEGYAVKSGVYVYRIIAGGESYAGTIIIAR
jgi:flagellar hook assembly protein FlgD